MNIQTLIAELNYLTMEAQTHSENTQVFIWENGDRHYITHIDTDTFEKGQNEIDIAAFDPDNCSDDPKFMTIGDLIKGLTLAATLDHLDEKAQVFIYSTNNQDNIGRRYPISMVDSSGQNFFIDLNASDSYEYV